MAPSPHRPRPKSSRIITDPRSGALNILARLESGTSTLDAVLEESGPLLAGLSHRDRALFNQLVYGVLRWRLRLDAVVETFADRPLKRISPTVLNVLRLGLFQILFMDRIPPSAAVNTAVELTRFVRAKRAAGFVNALLRNALRDPARFRLPDADRFPVDHIALEKSFPRWLVARWVDRFGVAETRRLCDAINTIPPITLRCNPLKGSLADLVAALKDQAAGIDPIDAVPGALDLIAPRRPLFEMQAFSEGRFAVQDVAAQLVSLFLAPRPEEVVLDACAGLGGKTNHLAQLMQNRGTVDALDIVPAKLRLLEKEARRQGVSIIRTRPADLNRPPAPDEHSRYDRILLDAPCTGLGVLRRNPDAKWSTRETDIARCADRQVRFLDHLAPLVKPDGVMVFAVCSTEPEENEAVVKRFLKNHPNFAISEPGSIDAPHARPFLDDDGCLRTDPRCHPMDGFFAARLQRRG